MILGATNILAGNAVLKTSIPARESDFDFIEMCGSFEVDELVGLNTELSETEVFEDFLVERTFDAFTIFLGHFEDNLQFGNFDSGGLPITQWNILRRVVGETNYTLIATVDNTAISRYFDVRAQSGINYEYAVQSVASGTAGNLVESEEVSMSFYGWSLQSLDYNPDTNTGTIYIFDVENNSDAINLIVGRTQFNNFSQKPKILRGVQRYSEGGLTTFPLTCNGTSVVEPNLATLSLLNAFIEDGNVKILKNGSGELYYVDTTGFSHKYRDILTNQASTNTNPNAQPYDISFNWVEVDEVSS